MEHLGRILFVLFYIKMIFIVSIMIALFAQVFFYPTWLENSTYTSNFYPTDSLIIYQRALTHGILAGSIMSLPLSGKEIAHVIEVVGMLHVLLIILLGVCLIVGVLLYAKQIRRFAVSSLLRIQLTIIYLLVLIIVGSIVLGNFSKVFIALHEFMFANDWWLLMESDVLINVYPPIFFQNLLYFILTVSLLLYIISITISLLISNKIRI